MTDTDWLGFEDPAERKAAQGPAFFASAPKGPRELAVYEAMMRGAPHSATTVLFTRIDEETGLEEWDAAPPPAYFDGGEAWMKILKWPTAPTIEQALAAQINARASLLGEWWTRLAAARAQDDALGYTELDDKQAPAR